MVGNAMNTGWGIERHARHSVKPFMSRMQTDTCVVVDGFRTTKICSACCKPTSHQKHTGNGKTVRIKGGLTYVNPICPRRIKLNQTTANRENQGGSNIDNGLSFSLFDEPSEPFQCSYVIESCKYVYIILLINEKSY
jgi:hypothetical protein